MEIYLSPRYNKFILKNIIYDKFWLNIILLNKFILKIIINVNK